jgi:glycosyltransferase involved in cell wall biosynthesis
LTVELVNDIQKEIIVIDDCSRDKTGILSRQFIESRKNENLIFFEQPRNMGKGAAIREGIRLASGDYIIIQDADLEYDPDEFNDLLIPVLQADADVVNGSRYMGSNPRRILFFGHTIANRTITFLSNLFSNIYLSDMASCYKLFRADIAKKIRFRENRFGFETEFIAKISKIPRLKVYEVGISYYGRSYEEGKKLGWKDAFRIIYCIIKYNVFTSYRNIYIPDQT